MKRYPISVAGDAYKGRVESKKRKVAESWRIARKIEDHINNVMADLPENCVRQFTSYFVASDIQEDPEKVRMLIMGVDGGSNGITVYKGDYEKALDNPA